MTHHRVTWIVLATLAAAELWALVEIVGAVVVWP